MNARVRKVLHDALELPAIDRARIAAELEASLEGVSPEEVESAWTTEVGKRVREIRSGKVRLIPAENALAGARKKLRSRR